MHELLHTLQHGLGLCGEQHLTFLGVLNEYPALQYCLNYVKSILN